MGRYDLREFVRVPEVQVAAVCDVDGRHARDALGDLKRLGRPTEGVQVTGEFRRILDRKDVDLVIVATPDHWHAYVVIAACAAGKDVYCEKPLAHNIAEGRAMVAAARRNKRVVQVGTQQRSGRHFQDAVEFVQSGRLGTVSLCRTWITTRTAAEGVGNPPDGRAPAEVDYDRWLGPAPLRPFNPNRFHYNFRWYWDYGNGLCNDWGVHLNDIVLWAMQVAGPKSVTAAGGRHEIHDNTDTPDTLDVYYEYPGFTHVYTVRRGQSLYGFHGLDHGIEFEGSNGVLTLSRAGWTFAPAGEQATAEKHGASEQHFAHVRNFLHCVRQREEKTASDIEDMHRATTTCHLANIAYKLGRRIWWDPVGERCYQGYDAQARKFLHEDSAANAYLLRPPRKPWSLTI
jgi:predicted dehydrogenase